MHHYPFHIGDYRKDTSHLSLLDHGVYRVLIDNYYLSELPLPADLTRICRLVGARTREEIESVSNVLTDFFDIKDDGYHHAGCQKVLAGIYGKSASAQKSAEARWAKHNAKHAPNMRQTCERIENECERIENASKNDAIGMLPNTQHPTPNTQHPKEIATDKSVVVDCKAKRNNGSRLHSDWVLPDDWFSWTIEQGLTPQEAYDTEARFRDYWIAVAGSKGVKLDWAATWRTWIRRNIESKPKKVESFAEKHTDRSWCDGVDTHTDRSWAEGL